MNRAPRYTVRGFIQGTNPDPTEEEVSATRTCFRISLLIALILAVTFFLYNSSQDEMRLRVYGALGVFVMTTLVVLALLETVLSAGRRVHAWRAHREALRRLRED
ncbi:MAG: hypothetical protein JO147_00315 [Actinobacteria bacterium]|nr:hypothetical protein [Actinomycetota bacterium]